MLLSNILLEDVQQRYNSVVIVTNNQTDGIDLFRFCSPKIVAESSEKAEAFLKIE
jgi:hypothetical protein